MPRAKDYLLDTQVLLWVLMGDEKNLSKKNRKLLFEGRNRVFISAVSGWEIMIKRAIGKLKVPNNLEQVLENLSFEKLPITFGHAFGLGELENYHKDPFDRMLISQAKKEGLKLVTADEKIWRYDVSVLKVG